MALPLAFFFGTHRRRGKGIRRFGAFLSKDARALSSKLMIATSSSAISSSDRDCCRFLCRLENLAPLLLHLKPVGVLLLDRRLEPRHLCLRLLGVGVLVGHFNRVA